MIADNEIVISTKDLHWLSNDQAWHYRILPFEKNGDLLTVYCEDPPSDVLAAELEIVFGYSVKLIALPGDQITRLLSTYYRKEQTGNSQPAVHFSASDDFLVNMITDAKNLKSSDIHIESYDPKCRVRIRVDGMMIERYILKKEDYPALVNKIKILSGLDIAEKRLPQDGRINFKQNGGQFDIRVSVLPTLFGEKIVLRLLNNNATDIDLYKLGFSENDLDNYLHSLKKTNGMLLISGPTGSGKTTSLYATLKLLNKQTRNILTIEDPVEYTLEGINQVQLKESIGLTFGAALRTFLRQDPDIIMVGEVRDPDTANMAVRAALTGHLVLSTIHTNSAWGIVSRLVDMGIPPFLLANTLNAAVAQRLLRLLCPRCKKEQDFSNDLYPRNFKPAVQISKHFLAAGCEHCHYTGYKGRKAVYEVIPVDYDLAVEIRNSNMQVHEILKEKGIQTISENAFDLFASGQTSIEEIYPLLLNY
ncbi:GspE/PulE family protein [Mucilaginibacter sp. L3T2-6]|uniref:GspE/PulE family protein n=1 Tax=Mucilaginibacter sp. L3T2-6 TaxID=3062491 RepID=UPI00267606F5|nr:GspE/PulE family protein [Mucilaginibacter sp. L3T2-6]MDO3645232.1 GspE/PulE family protein [Mucilaginibacter sp. L3T2-6]MDV6217684.1 GspE/PulE family protein [Mucilaginibacter sp. L3T2-6]